MGRGRYSPYTNSNSTDDLTNSRNSRIMVFPLNNSINNLNNLDPLINTNRDNIRLQLIDLERNNSIINRLNRLLRINDERDMEDVKVGLINLEKYYQSFNLEEETECNICVNSFEKGEKMYKMVCGHQFCINCITKWFKDNVKCPNCNQDLRDLIEQDDDNKEEIIKPIVNVNHNFENNVVVIDDSDSDDDIYADMPSLEPG